MLVQRKAVESDDEPCAKRLHADYIELWNIAPFGPNESLLKVTTESNMEVWARHNLWYLLPGRAILDRGVGDLHRATLKSSDGDGVFMRRLAERGRIYLAIRPDFAV